MMFQTSKIGQILCVKKVPFRKSSRICCMTVVAIYCTSTGSYFGVYMLGAWVTERFWVPFPV